MTSSTLWRRALRISTPVMLGYIPLGIAFGVLTVQLGFSISLAMAMSVVIYSGAGQFLLLTLLAANASLITITTAGLLLNSRHAFYGLSLKHLISFKRLGEIYTMFALTDETYALLNNPTNKMTAKLATRVAAFNQLWWCLGTLIGALAGHWFAFEAGGLAFSLTALFIVLTLEQAKHSDNHRPFIYAVLAAIPALLLLPNEHFLLAAIIGGCFLLWADMHLSLRRTNR